ncbi:MAG: energy transducer TonB [Bacteroidetes bacterium]|nr:energy transducer TonB [Bacteroidota bacterium]
MKRIICITFIILITILPVFSQVTKPYNDKQNMPVVLEQEAYYPAGMPALYKYFRDNITYTREAIEMKITGEVMVSFDVLTDSTLLDITLLSGVGYGIDEQVVGLFKPLKYAPSIQNGVKLKMNVIVTIPVRAKAKE